MVVVCCWFRCDQQLPFERARVFPVAIQLRYPFSTPKNINQQRRPNEQVKQIISKKTYITTASPPTSSKPDNSRRKLCCNIAQSSNERRLTTDRYVKSYRRLSRSFSLRAIFTKTKQQKHSNK
jgi:hypothetical protein